MSKAIATLENQGISAFKPKGTLADRFAAKIRDERAARQGGAGLWPTLKVSGAKFQFMEQNIGDSVRGIILDVVNDHRYYDTGYTPGEVSPPACAAVGLDPDEMVPDPKGSDVQSTTTCSKCPLNAWGSSTRKGSRGKACQQRKRLTFLPWDGKSQLAKSEGARIIVPVTSGNNLALLGKLLEGVGRPLAYTLVDISVTSDPTNQYTMSFAPVTPINDPKLFAIIESKITEGQTSLMASPIFEASAAPKGKAKAGTKGRRTVVRSKA